MIEINSSAINDRRKTERRHFNRRKSDKRFEDNLTQEEFFLHNPVFGEDCINELREIDKHEIITKICILLGDRPTDFAKSEEIFQRIKYDIVKYILHHEYCVCSENSIRSRLLNWVDCKTNPANEKKLNDFINEYLK